MIWVDRDSKKDFFSVNINGEMSWIFGVVHSFTEGSHLHMPQCTYQTWRQDLKHLPQTKTEQ